MAERLDVYLHHYPTQYLNCMSAESEFITFVNHAIQLALNLTAQFWAVLSILLETQDVNASHVLYRIKHALWGC